MKMESNRMAPGTGEESYACNSQIQAISISNVFPMVKEALEELYSMMLPKCVMIAELGCASGPNTVLLLPEVIDITYKTYKTITKSQEIPEINLFLNDVPANDFNSICNSLPEFFERLEKQRNGELGPCFISATPGSYYKRLFPSNFLHFIHNSNSAHWLSQVPKGLIKENGECTNKGNIYIDDTSPPEVLAAYQEQFRQDFTSLLKFRAQEMVVGGRMIINLMESTESCKPQDLFLTKITTLAVKDMVTKGLIDGNKMDTFEIPFYPPTTEEVQRFVEAEGSFYIHKHNHFTLDWDLPTSSDNEEVDVYVRAKFIAMTMRTGTEYLLASHFGQDVMDDLFSEVFELVAQGLSRGKLEAYHQVICLIKK